VTSHAAPECRRRVPTTPIPPGPSTRWISLGVPYEDTWSCYEGGEIHCGLCGTCNERKEAFQLAGVPDPTKYRK
jgi:hypothetical protein